VTSFAPELAIQIDLGIRQHLVGSLTDRGGSDDGRGRSVEGPCGAAGGVHRRGSHAYCDRHADVKVETSMVENIVRFESHTVIQGPVSRSLRTFGGSARLRRVDAPQRSVPPVQPHVGGPDPTGDDLCRLDTDGYLRWGSDRVRATDANRLSGDAPLVRLSDDTGSTRVHPGGRRDHNDRPPRCRRGTLWLDEVHEARRSMDGEPGADPHPELPEAFPGGRLKAIPHRCRRRAPRASDVGVMPAGASRNAADLGRGQVVQIDATGALSKEASGGGLITAHGRCGQPTLAKQPFTIGIDQLTHHIPRRR